MKIQTAGGALVLASMVCAGPALAQVEGQAKLGNLRVTLFDLDLSDAVTPSITFSLPPAGASAEEIGGGIVFYAAESPKLHERYNKAIVASPLVPAAMDYSNGTHASMQASYRHASALEQELSVSSRLGANDAQAYFILESAAFSDTWYFTLSPNTGATFSADFSFTGNTTLLPSHDQTLYVYAYMLAFDSQRWEYNTQDSQMGMGSSSFLPRAIDDSDILSVSMRNPGQAEGSGQLSLSLQINSRLDPIRPVPEPSSWAMLLPGIALLGWRRARRTT